MDTVEFGGLGVEFGDSDGSGDTDSQTSANLSISIQLKFIKVLLVFFRPTWAS